MKMTTTSKENLESAVSQKLIQLNKLLERMRPVQMALPKTKMVLCSKMWKKPHNNILTSKGTFWN